MIMSKPYDATLNEMLDLRSAEWAECFSRLLGLPVGQSSPLDSDLATTLQADRVYLIESTKPYILHLELEANPRRGIPPELLRYNTLVAHHRDLPVETVLILLRPKAVASDMTGHFERKSVTGNPITTFHYHIERIWERSVEFWLGHGIGLSPLALLTDEAEQNLGSALNRVHERLVADHTDDSTMRSLLGSSYILCGLRYQSERIAETFRRLAMLMEESTTYQEILKKGVSQGISQGISQGLSQGISQGISQGLRQGLSQGERTVLLRVGTKRFGEPSEAIYTKLQGISDPARLESLAERLLDVHSWEELFSE
jgi:hypothetical protein